MMKLPNPSELFTTISNQVLTCENSRTRLKLFKHKKPANNFLHPFDHHQEQSTSLHASISGGATPLPDFSVSTPAWDPSSRRPVALCQPRSFRYPFPPAAPQFKLVVPTRSS